MLNKKEKNYPTESFWTVLQGENDGNLMVIRRNESAKDFAGNIEYKYRIGVAVPFNQSKENGFPVPEETDQLNMIEDTLSAYLETDKTALLVLVITTSGMREFVFYSNQRLDIKNLVITIQEKINSHQLQSYIAEDEQWELFRQFC